VRLLFHCWVITLPIHLTVINYKILGKKNGSYYINKELSTTVVIEIFFLNSRIFI